MSLIFRIADDLHLIWVIGLIYSFHVNLESNIDGRWLVVILGAVLLSFFANSVILLPLVAKSVTVVPRLWSLMPFWNYASPRLTGYPLRHFVKIAEALIQLYCPVWADLSEKVLPTVHRISINIDL